MALDALARVRADTSIRVLVVAAHRKAFVPVPIWGDAVRRVRFVGLLCAPGPEPRMPSVVPEDL
jgi:hypothetical protein